MMPKNVTESATLDELYSSGDWDGFFDKVYKVIMSKIRYKFFLGMEHEDVAQYVVEKLLEALQSYDPQKAKVTTFVHTVIAKKICECHRKSFTHKVRMTARALELVDTFAEEDLPALQIGIDVAGFDNANFVTDMTYYVPLTERERAVFTLRAAGFEFVEIAQRLGLSKGRVSQLWKSIENKYKAL